MAEEIRVGQPTALEDILGSQIQRLQERFSGRISQLWWSNPDAEEWLLVEAFFLAPFAPLTREDVKRDPAAFDHALHEWLRCDRCTAKKAMVRDEKTGATGGYEDCPLEDPNPADWPHLPGGSKNHHFDIKLLRDGTWDWVKRRCTRREHRSLEIGRRLRTVRQIGGGLEGIEVLEEPPWHSQVDREQADA